MWPALLRLGGLSTGLPNAVKAFFNSVASGGISVHYLRLFTSREKTKIMNTVANSHLGQKSWRGMTEAWKTTRMRRTEAGSIDRVYDDALSVMESCGYQIELAGAVLLGYDRGLILEQDASQAVLAVLESAVKRDRLVVHMGRAFNIDSSVPAGFVDQFERGLRFVVK